MQPDHRALTAEDVLAHGGWHPRYARVIAVTSDGDYGFALIDGNGDGRELETEIWTWQDGTWTAGSSSGAGPLQDVGPVQTGGQIGHAYFAYGSAPGRQAITIAFDGQLHTTPVNSFGIWAFIKIRSRPHSHGYPTPET
jgi:hypothetical protein